MSATVLISNTACAFQIKEQPYHKPPAFSSPLFLGFTCSFKTHVNDHSFEGQGKQRKPNFKSKKFYKDR